MSFGRNLERIRKERKISQTKLGEELGLTQQMVSSYEKGASSPNVEILVKVADFFQISIDELIGHQVYHQKRSTAETRLLQYFQNLNAKDQEKCITIAQTLIEDRELGY